MNINVKYAPRQIVPHEVIARMNTCEYNDNGLKFAETAQTSDGIVCEVYLHRSWNAKESQSARKSISARCMKLYSKMFSFIESVWSQRIPSLSGGWDEIELVKI